MNTVAWISLLGTLVGGGLAIISARIAARSAHELTLKREREAKMREKAEEVYTLVLKLRHEARAWCNAASSGNMGLIDSDFKLPGYEKDRIRLLCDLYLPRLSDTAREFMDIYTDFGRYAVAGMIQWQENQRLSPTYTDELESKFSVLASRIEDIRKELSKAVNETPKS